jgi:gliding motility associated protien GldN
MLHIRKFILVILGSILGTLNINAQVLDSPPMDGVYDKIHVINRKPIPYTPMREADAYWQKRIWRVVDMREKINHPFYYPTEEINGRKSFIQVVLKAIEEGSITAYEGADDEFMIPYTYQQFTASMADTQRQTLQRTEPPYDFYDTIITKKFDPLSIMKFRIKEDWFFDKQRSVMDVRILGICPILDEYEDDGVTLKGTKPLFWIYFPEAREVFAQSEVYNRYNDAARMSYDDLFYKRMFNSYIYKESNVYDRRISEYTRGMDALLESERIKNEIFLKEHDLWEY